MKNRRFVWILVVTLLSIGLAACGAPASKAPASAAPGASAAPAASASAASATAAAQGKVFTLAELAKYNGQNGQPAYVAVDGIVYDVSNVPLWKGGTHQGLHQAGTDLSDAINQSPHGKKNLEGLPVVGTLVK